MAFTSVLSVIKEANYFSLSAESLVEDHVTDRASHVTS
jgi:hypothetical protein